MKDQVLSRLSVDTIDLMKNASSSEEIPYFRNLILDVDSTEEPSTVRWTDLNATFLIWARGRIRSYVSFLIICVLIDVICYKGGGKLSIFHALSAFII